jgi:hypothetical protein
VFTTAAGWDSSDWSYRQEKSGFFKYQISWSPRFVNCLFLLKYLFYLYITYYSYLLLWVFVNV